jgi:acyl-CoA thioester hydrolase
VLVMSAGREPPHPRGRYRLFSTVETRWMDNDVYGHVNNVVYYSYFDTVINRHLIEAGGLDIHGGAVIGVCAESQCRYFEPVSFPETLDAGLGIARAGRSSVVYEIGLFRRGAETAAAQGHFVHVFVDRASMRPVPIPEAIRASFAGL